MAAPWNFIASFLNAALWSSLGDDAPLDATHDICDFAPETRERLENDCHTFYDANHPHVHCLGAPLASDFGGPIAGREAAMAGHDFWLTRCGHGAGFWDGDWPEPHASILDKASKAFGNIDLYVGDDGLIYA
ncbi:hypothetical protein F9K91_24905 [Brucella tritici]|uniref:Uncharacterized protein n=1 Tax=Brucella tritici TaxID=94626 RepID=A0A7X6FNN3_9HYPH|nr:hypothetical protein [Brucella tritici]KAB2661441.1 hypothetical protein F9K91_24905 [Brucella tritici]NKW09157.1 hypothetical protein [Brucella tritici]